MLFRDLLDRGDVCCESAEDSHGLVQGHVLQDVCQLVSLLGSNSDLVAAGVRNHAGGDLLQAEHLDHRVGSREFVSFVFGVEVVVHLVVGLAGPG